MERVSGGCLHLTVTEQHRAGRTFSKMHPNASLVKNRLPQSETNHQFHKRVLAHLYNSKTKACPPCLATRTSALEEEAWPLLPPQNAELYPLLFQWQPFNLCRAVKQKELKWQMGEEFTVSRGISIIPYVQLCECEYAYLCLYLYFRFFHCKTNLTLKESQSVQSCTDLWKMTQMI